MNEMRKARSWVVAAAPVLCAIAAVAFALGCSSSQGKTLITGKAWIDAPLQPGECRRLALEAARRDAYAQMLDVVRKETGGDQQTIGDQMAHSSYVASRVRRAIQQSPIHETKFSNDGTAVVVVEMDMNQIRQTAFQAQNELR